MLQQFERVINFDANSDEALLDDMLSLLIGSFDSLAPDAMVSPQYRSICETANIHIPGKIKQIHQVLSYFVRCLKNNFVSSKSYHDLEKGLQRAQGMIRKHIKQQQEMQLTIECLEEELQTQHAQATQALHQAETQNKDLLHSTFLQRERVALLRRDKMKLTRDKECLLEQLRLAGINQALTKEKNLETPGDTLQQICANVIETNRQPWSSQLKKQYEQTVKKEAGVKGITHLQNIQLAS